MVEKAKELSEKHGYFQTLQFDNPANPRYHANTTGPEILRDFAGQRLDYWVTGWGTGGTLIGAGRVLKAARPELQIIAVDPAGTLRPLLRRWGKEPLNFAPLFSGAALLSGEPFKPHKIQARASSPPAGSSGNSGLIAGRFLYPAGLGAQLCARRD